MNNNETSRNVPWLALAFLLAAIISFVNIANQNVGGIVYNMVGHGGSAIPPMATAPSPGYPSDMMESQGSVTVSAGAPTRAIAPQPPMMDSAYAGGSSGMMKPDYYPSPNYYGGEATAKDTREFNKIYYSAEMLTRNVQKLVTRIETIVRGHEGRVDNTTSSFKYGSVSFVVPQSKFDAFRSEIESLVDWRFITVNVNSQNMLPQKQSIEQQQTYTEKNLADLQIQRKQTVTDHTNKVKSDQDQINANAAVETALRAEVTGDPARQAVITSLLAELSQKQANLRSHIALLNSNYANSLSSIDAQIKYANQNLDAVKTQDQNLLDNMATVSGSISVRWISLWEIAQAYLPGYSIPVIFLLLSAISYWWHRKRGPIFGIL